MLSLYPYCENMIESYSSSIMT